MSSANANMQTRVVYWLTIWTVLALACSGWKRPIGRGELADCVRLCESQGGTVCRNSPTLGFTQCCRVDQCTAIYTYSYQLSSCGRILSLKHLDASCAD